MTYLGRQKTDQPANGDTLIDVTKIRDEFTFARFFRPWQQHHTYWHAYAVKHGIPLLQVRYEDVCEAPRNAIRRVLEFLTVFSKTDITRLPESSPFQHDCMLRNARKFPEAAALVTQDELDAVLGKTQTYLMDAFGYETRVDVGRDFFAAKAA